MSEHGKKMIAPIIITVLTVAYYFIYFLLLISLVSGIWKYALGLFPIAFSAVTIGVCIRRIQEIRSGEEDDLSQY